MIIKNKFDEIIFEGADLRGAYLQGANLQKADLRWANLRWADLRWANLRWADLQGADLQWTNLRGADLQKAHLREANLRGANLQGADLQGANLWGTIGDGRYIKSLQITKYNICYTHDRLQIGCKNFSIQEWQEFDYDSIRQMNGQEGLDLWIEWKDWIFKLIKKSPAMKTKEE